MRKNTTMRIAAVLLALTLITTCFVGGTFAKYTTSEDVTASGRVAHWGFNATDSQAAFVKLFDVTDDSGILVQGDGSAANPYLFAPGTENSVEFTVVNADATTNPEVAFKVTVDTTGTSTITNELEAAMVFYFDDAANATPLTWAQLIEKVEAMAGTASVDGVQEYAPGSEVPAALANGATHTIGWAWAFEDNRDAEDTALGNKVVEQLEKLTLAIKITVDQLDVYPTP